MSADVESDVLSFLSTNTAWTEDTDLFRGPILPAGQIAGSYPIPSRCVFVRFASGIPPVIHRSSSLAEKEWLVDVLHRSNPEQYGTGRTDAQALLDAVHDASVTSGAFNGYVDVHSQTSSPQWIDKDDQGCHYFVFTLRLRKLEA